MRIILISVTAYNTKQKECIISFFRTHSNCCYTADEVIDNVPEASKATIYRIISHLAEDGYLMKVQGMGRSVCYQYCNPSTCPEHMHIICTKCEASFHLDSETSQRVRRAVSGACGFEILNETVLKGICPECRGKL